MGKIELSEMLNVFNCGYGFIVIVDNEIDLGKLSYEVNCIGNVI